MMFDLRALGYFVAAYEEKSITGAARRCFIAQPSISVAIRSLESVLNTPLFERTKSGLIATPSGERLYPRARSLLAESSAIVQEFQRSPKTELRLYLQDDVLISRIGPVLSALSEWMPHALLKLTPERNTAAVRLIAEHCKTEDEWFLPLWNENYVMLVPEKHPLRFKSDFELGDLHGIPFIERPYCALNLVFTRMLAEKGIVLDIRASAAREEVLLKLVELGLGLAVVPESHSANLRNVVVRPLKDPMAMERRMGLACALSDAVSVQIIGQLAARLSGMECEGTSHSQVKASSAKIDLWKVNPQPLKGEVP